MLYYYCSAYYSVPFNWELIIVTCKHWEILYSNSKIQVDHKDNQALSVMISRLAYSVDKRHEKHFVNTWQYQPCLCVGALKLSNNYKRVWIGDMITSKYGLD